MRTVDQKDVKYRAVQRFSAGRGKRFKPGDTLLFPERDDQAQRLVDIGRIVRCTDEDEALAGKAASKAKIEVDPEIAQAVEDTLKAPWDSVMQALKQYPVEALQLALAMESDGKRRVRLMGQLKTEIEARTGK